MQIPKIKSLSVAKLQNKSGLILFLVIFVGFGSYAVFKSFALGCTITAPASSADRKVSMTMSGCSGSRYFRVSESSDYGTSQGVKVNINNVAPDNSYADVSVTYPNGTPATGSTPFAIPTQPKSVKVLAVLFTFDDANGQTAGLGAYQTPSWVQKMMFGGGSFDGVFNGTNTVKDFIYNSSNGSVNLTGNAYPQIVHLPLEQYRQFLGSNGDVIDDFGKGILKYIQSTNPSYLSAGNYDMVVGLSGEEYSVQRDLYPSSTTNDYGNLHQLFEYAIPNDTSKSIISHPMQETRTSTDASTVITRYNINSVSGVWLASDPNMTGTNYYTGGSIASTSDTHFSYIKLGTPLPNPNTQVIVKYTGSVGNQTSTSSPDSVTTYAWYSHFSHELQHRISGNPGYSFTQRLHIGDLYFSPDDGGYYDVMSGGTMSVFNDPTLGGASYDNPTLLSAYHRNILGFATPYTLQYGQNETSIRVYRLENGDPANNSRNTMVKIPLIPPGDAAFETRDWAAASGISNTSTSDQHTGVEYLLLEWRQKGAIENSAYNFDRSVPTQGLAIYHVLESEPYAATAGGQDIVRLIDATPDTSSFNDNISDTSTSPALFGPQSGVMSYTTQAYWQEKTPNNDAHSFKYLLSPGIGNKTLFAQFADFNGNITGTQQFSINLTASQQGSQRLPTMSVNLANGEVIPSSKSVVATWNAPNGAKNIRFYVDGKLKQDTNEANLNINPGNSKSYFINNADFTNGSHQLLVVFYDSGFNKLTQTVNFSTSGGGDTTPPIVSFNQPSNGSTVWGTIHISANGTDNDTTSRSELYIDGTLTYTTINNSNFGGYDYIMHTAQYSNGTHTILAKVYDPAGNVGSASGSFIINNTSSSSDTTPPTVSITSPTNNATVSGQVPITANASDNVGVSQVTFQVDGTTKSTVTASPYSYTWDSTVVANGTHTINVIATDAAGNNSNSSITVNVNNGDKTPPVVSITNPTNNATVSGSTSISANASDNVGVTGVTFQIDGATKVVDNASPYSYSWDTTTITNGAHTITAIASDAAGNTSTNTININVSNADTIPPTVSLTSPANNATVSGGVSIAANASDNIGVAQVAFQVDGLTKAADTASPYTYTWDSSLVTNGSHTITAVATDAAGNTASNSVVVNVSNGDTSPPTQPANLTSTANAYNKVTLNWTASTDNVGVAGYYIVRNGTTIAQTTGSAATYVDSTVNAQTSYNYQVMAYDTAGNTSTLSLASNVTTPPAPESSPPTQPTNLVATAASTSQINLTWNASSDNIGVTGYDVYRNGTKIATSSTNSFGDLGLAPATSYSYYVIARDAAGNSSLASNTASATTNSAVTTGSISGSVYASNGNGTLAGVTISLTFSGATHTYTSSSNGSYSIPNVPAGNYAVTYSKIGYTTKTVTVTVISNNSSGINITLAKSKGNGR
ncbi:MAG TPA: Ig-like domain-containing protein [Candidatus Saccharimonadales bacterium]|nr:Ig-like domain-containing protein [Candidatus Saccharimonadales bacterium]